MNQRKDESGKKRRLDAEAVRLTGELELERCTAAQCLVDVVTSRTPALR